MADLVASPSNNLIYAVEKPRLSSAIHQALLVLKSKQTKEALEVFKTKVDALLYASIDRVAYAGFISAAKDVACSPDKAIALKLKRESAARAKQSAIWITDTTGTALDITAAMSKARALSLGRADAAAINELSLAFFGGTRYGWGLDPSARKTWELSSAHDVDDTCDDNADEGPISINDAFQSGHFIPPAHIGCECELGLVRLKNVKRRYFS